MSTSLRKLTSFSPRSLNLIATVFSQGADVRVLLSERSPPLTCALMTRTLILNPNDVSLYDLILGARLFSFRAARKSGPPADDPETLDLWLTQQAHCRWVFESQAGLAKEYPGIGHLAGLYTRQSFAQREIFDQRVLKDPAVKDLDSLINCYISRSVVRQQKKAQGPHQRDGMQLDPNRLLQAKLSKRTGLHPTPPLFRDKSRTFEKIWKPEEHCVILAFCANDLRIGQSWDGEDARFHVTRFLCGLLRVHETLNTNICVIGFSDNLVELNDGREHVVVHARTIIKSLDQKFDDACWGRLSSLLGQPPYVLRNTDILPSGVPLPRHCSGIHKGGRNRRIFVFHPAVVVSAVCRLSSLFSQSRLHQLCGGLRRYEYHQPPQPACTRRAEYRRVVLVPRSPRRGSSWRISG